LKNTCGNGKDFYHIFATFAIFCAYISGHRVNGELLTEGRKDREDPIEMRSPGPICFGTLVSAGSCLLNTTMSPDYGGDQFIFSNVI
jgi:hypothetical protein